MHVKFVDYPHLYSADYFNPKQKVVQNASLIERALYWLGLVALLIMLPFTIMFLLFLLTRRKWNLTYFIDNQCRLTTMKIPIYQVDAFASELFKGNPAAVCPLDEWLPDQIMQNIAMENNLYWRTGSLQRAHISYYPPITRRTKSFDGLHRVQRYWFI